MPIKIRYQNVRGLRGKANVFSSNILNSDAHLHAITESWFNSNFNSSEYITNEFVSHRRDRNYENTHTVGGGGCWIIHKKQMNVIRRYDLESNINFVEDLWVQAKLSNSEQHLYICVVYITSMPSNLQLYIDFANSCKESLSKIDSSDRILIIGDFNVRNLKWSMSHEGILTSNISFECNKATEVSNLISYANLRQHNSIVNNVDGNILDLVLSSDPLNAIIVTESPEALVNIDNYHPPLEITIKEQIEYMPVCNHRKFNFRRANYDSICDELQLIDWEFIKTMPINSAVDLFYGKLNEIIKKYTPLVRTNRKFPHWFNAELKNALQKKERAHKKYKRSNLLEDYRIFSSLRSECKLLIDKCHEEYIAHIRRNLKTNVKFFWAYSKSKRQTNSYPSQFKYNNQTANTPGEVCELFATFFRSTYTNEISDNTSHIITTANPTTENPINITPYDVDTTISKIDPNKNGGPDGIPNFFLKQTSKVLSIPLAMIFNRSIEESEVPIAFKTSLSTAIYKKGDESDVSNYRQVCMANSISIILEKIMNTYLLSILESKITPKQHGFMRNRSTNTNLIEYVSHISAALDSGLEVHTIYTDFEKAFDSVNHNILISKLTEMGLHAKVICWLKSYLKSRQIYVAFNGHKSAPFSPSSGVPQGSVLGPLLFNVFINDLSQILTNFILLFADDLKIYRIIRSLSDLAELQADLDRLHEWTRTNKLRLNISKCCAMSFSNKLSPTQAVYNINGSQLDVVDSMKDLGVTFDSKLSFNEHVNTIVKKAYSMLGFVMRTASRFNDLSCMNFLYNALVRSRLEYNCAVWNPHNITFIDKIEKVQRKYTRHLFYNFKYQKTPYDQRLKILNIMKLEHRREYFDSCLLHRITNDRNFVQNSRPIFGISRNSSRLSIRFNPSTPRNNYGLFKNPSIRTQLLYNKKFKHIDIINLNKNQFKNEIQKELMKSYQ